MSTIIAIAGASGSGKSTLTEALVSALSAQTGLTVVTLPLDAYYRDLSHLTFEERDRQNFDHPDALEIDLYLDHLVALRDGQPVAAPVYDFANHTRADGTQWVPAADIVLAEGIFTLQDPRLLPLYSLTVFVEAPLDVCLARRIARDARERGRDEASVRSFWYERALPMFEQHCATTRARAALVLDGLAPAEEGVNAVLDWHHRQATTA